MEKNSLCLTVMILTSPTHPPSPWCVSTITGVPRVSLDTCASVHTWTAVTLADTANRHSIVVVSPFYEASQVLKDTIDPQPAHTANKSILVFNCGTYKTSPKNSVKSFCH